MMRSSCAHETCQLEHPLGVFVSLTAPHLDLGAQRPPQLERGSVLGLSEGGEQPGTRFTRSRSLRHADERRQQRRTIEQAEILFLAAEAIFFKERALVLSSLLELFKVT